MVLNDKINTWGGGGGWCRQKDQILWTNSWENVDRESQILVLFQAFVVIVFFLCNFSALSELVPSQLVLFAQSFGIPVSSMRWETQTRATLCGLKRIYKPFDGSYNSPFQFHDVLHVVRNGQMTLSKARKSYTISYSMIRTETLTRHTSASKKWTTKSKSKTIDWEKRQSIPGAH